MSHFFKVISLPRISNPEGSPFESNHIQDLLNHWPQSGSGVQVKYTANEAIEQFKRSGFSPTTFGHELVHRIQEAVLQRYGRTREFYRPVWVDNKQEQIKELHNYSDVVYLGAGRAAFVPCPEAITLQALAERIPNSLRDQLFYQGYVKQPATSQRQPDGTISCPQPPNYLINELSSRRLGALMALELRDETLKYNASQRDQVMFDPGIEPIVVYALILAVMADEQKSSFKDEHDRQQFFGIVRHLVDHCALLNTIFARRENFQGFIASTPDTHFNTFARSEDCAELRQAVERIFGVELLRKITHNQQVDPQQVGEPIIQVIPTNSLSYLEEQR